MLSKLRLLIYGMVLAMWVVMMIAMMLPSAAPMVVLHARGASALDTTLLASGYLAIWAAAGIPAYIGSEFMPMAWAPLVLGVAGVYQFTPAKQACLSKCRTPVDFMMQRWGRSAFRLGVEHGLWCLGCCWTLMAVLVLVEDDLCFLLLALSIKVRASPDISSFLAFSIQGELDTWILRR